MFVLGTHLFPGSVLYGFQSSLGKVKSASAFFHSLSAKHENPTGGRVPDLINSIPTAHE
jgi:hypothetical protein